MNEKKLEQFIRVIKAKDLRSGDLLIVDVKSGLCADDLLRIMKNGPNINVLIVMDIGTVKHIKLGR